MLQLVIFVLVLWILTSNGTGLIGALLLAFGISFIVSALVVALLTKWLD